MALQYSYGIKNKYRPTNLITNAYGWGSGPQYNQADVPNGLAQAPGGLSADQFMQQFAYEWFQSSGLGNDANLSNPPFVSGAAGRLHPALRDAETGGPARILRGYIRRAEREVGVPMSNARLYFMFNPETIQRDYVSYLDSVALDPFNTVFQSKNDVAPPSFMDFSFSLFFDRQEEATQPDHPGVFVDYQFFDLVVRNVTPDDPNQTNATIPDNGVMMVNPRDIAVIFSPQLMVQGRPLNASVSFEKFTHRMTPTRMTIRLTMRVIYIGPYKDPVDYVAETQQAEAAIPIEEEKTAANTPAPLPAFGGYDPLAPQPTNPTPAEKAKLNNDGANWGVRSKALEWAKANCSNCKYVPGTDPRRVQAPNFADCSGLIVASYKKGEPTSEKMMHWESFPGTGEMMRLAGQYPKLQQFVPLSSIVTTSGGDMVNGDLVMRDGHIAFYEKHEGTSWRIYDAASATMTPQVGSRLWNPNDPKHGLNGSEDPGFTHLLRPTPLNPG